ncbi:prolyl oligopeptidase family serine peptidase [Rubrivivax gelatinosus]|uniref:S9 family peptidase n=1 Tax=Rubrivivax gelatinosus TaxID=28068 RepID=A0ABS1DX29_RUBGE|nr:prolyl oligopeptidase family serine peptidase [Rubrivivax gelatinosus]MBK1713899.1 S9 family peptidase [Rubrivivax gelatinosus]
MISRRHFTVALPLAATLPTMTLAATPTEDDLLWLEDVQGERALAWVRARNAETEAVLEKQPGFAATRARIRSILDSRDRIPAVVRRGAWLYNLWQDEHNPRGLWRRTTLDEYRKREPAWQTVLDVDALGRAEGVNWTWAGAIALGPDYRRCLVKLSRGGADAHVVREFDIETRRFVDGGFELPEAKSEVEWVNADELLVATDFGPGALTDSGYPRVVKRWRRGTPLSAAKTVFEGEKTDVAAGMSVDHTPGYERTVFARSVDFYRSEMFLLQGERLLRIDKPADAELGFWKSRVLITLRSDWTVAGRSWPSGSLLVADAAAFLRGERVFDALFTPTATRSLAGMATTRDTLLVEILDNVAGRIEEWLQADGRWQRREVAAPFPGTLSVAALHDPELADDPLADAYLLQYTDFLTPDTLSLGRVGSDAREVLKSRPAFYDAAGMRVEQRFAKSRDGTRVPYFVVWPRAAKADGANPTLLYGYGGFEVSMQPYYSGVVGSSWLAQGGVYVLANIRGGGEFGPAWHQAAVGANRQKAYDDFAAVAEDLIATRVTSPRHLGIQGGSNGGLLVGAVMVQRPELFNAVVCQVPLLDMKRYTKLLAGASWMAEYGDPDDPAQWAFISRYSPYQNVRREQKMPHVLFVTSTRDDRVHPGHARKMAERMRQQGHPVMYWENIEGGHGGAADNAQRAQMTALEYAFLRLQLGR